MTREGSKGDVSGEARAFAPVGAAPTKVRPGPPRKGKALVTRTRHFRFRFSPGGSHHRRAAVPFAAVLHAFLRWIFAKHLRIK